MVNIAKALIGLAALAFVLAVAANNTQFVPFSSAEGYSFASTNLSLLAIALMWCFGTGRSASLP